MWSAGLPLPATPFSHGKHREVVLKAPSAGGESDFLQTQLAIVLDIIDTELA
jgi:hypothetical protein